MGSPKLSQLCFLLSANPGSSDKFQSTCSCNSSRSSLIAHPILHSHPTVGCSLKEKGQFFLLLSIQFLHKKFLATTHNNMVVSCFPFFQCFILTRSSAQLLGHVKFHPTNPKRFFTDLARIHLLSLSRVIICLCHLMNHDLITCPLHIIHNARPLLRTDRPEAPKHPRCEYGAWVWGRGRFVTILSTQYSW